MLPPEAPRGGAIRPAVLDDQADGGLEDASGRVTAGVGPVGPVGVEVLATAGAMVLRGDHAEVGGPPGEGIAQVVEGAPSEPIAVGAVATAWAGPPALISARDADLGRGQVLDAVDPLGGVGSVFARSWHGGSPGREGLPGITHCDGVLFTNTAR